MESSQHITFANAEDASRYEARVAGHDEVAMVAYEHRGDTIVFTHTAVPSTLEGKGVGSALAHYVLEDAKRQGLRVAVKCPFITAYIGRHPEYRGLMSSEPSLERGDDAAIDEAVDETFPASDPPAWMP
ncbi:MAG TPA: GNAT family N-acetyltransferase [Gemmatimonadaceae bacterium]|nr:GNAT family N-acetyltransferase [Gemmatimonadaceae bacterium]